MRGWNMAEKIVILGIANGGKTSLLRTLKREFKSLADLKPTKGIERTSLECFSKKIVVWDFGGQSKYRETYKKKAKNYFVGIEELFYVIDFQDQDSFSEAITYFQEIKEDLAEYSPKASMNILINKFDPGFEEMEDNMKLYETINKKFSELAEPFSARVTKTSIFNPISVIQAFSKPVFGNTTLYDNFQFAFYEFVNRTEAKFIIIFSKNLMEIGNYFDPSVNQQQMRDVAFEIFNVFDDKKLELSDISLHTDAISVRMIQFEAGGDPYYFTYGYDIEAVQDPAPLSAEAFNVLQEVKTIMKYF
nr:ADP-ribosylation factor-like protein [Candidatus Prometheoarchaeum syntrophicum]